MIKVFGKESGGNLDGIKESDSVSHQEAQSREARVELTEAHELPPSRIITLNYNIKKIANVSVTILHPTVDADYVLLYEQKGTNKLLIKNNDLPIYESHHYFSETQTYGAYGSIITVTYYPWSGGDNVRIFQNPPK